MDAPRIEAIVLATKNRQVRDAASALLASLGETLNISRAYAFRFDRGERVLATQIREWCAPGIEAQIDNPDLQNTAMEDMGLGRWADVLLEGGAIAGPVAELPEGERAFLQAQAIRSIIVVPIAIKGETWGCLGFDDCQRSRQWDHDEQTALRHAATLLGESIALIEK